MDREVRYCTTEDGVRIAYCVEGEGPPLLVCPQFVESFSLNHLYPPLERFVRRLGEGRALIRYDPRGTGLSQREVADISFIGRVEDLKAVLKEAALGPASVWAPTGAGPPAIALVVQQPELVAALILYATFPWVGAVFPPDALMGLAALAKSNWPMAARAFADVGSAREEAGDELISLADIYVQSASGEVVALAIEGSAHADITPQLPSVAVRTLIVHRINDSFCPVAVGQKLASAIPGARLVTPPGTIHGFDLGDAEAVLKAVASFLDEDPATRALPTEVARVDSFGAAKTGVTMIMFADIVDSTALTERLGDAAFRDKARDLDTALRNIIRQNVGTPIEGKLLGDGVLATYASAKQAIEAALACGRAGDEMGLPLHLGLHAGDVIREDNNVFGGAVNIAARVSALSGPGEVLVSETVRSLARTSAGVLFEDRGEHSLKGIADPVRVYGVSSRE